MWKCKAFNVEAQLAKSGLKDYQYNSENGKVGPFGFKYLSKHNIEVFNKIADLIKDDHGLMDGYNEKISLIDEHGLMDSYNEKISLISISTITQTRKEIKENGLKLKYLKWRRRYQKISENLLTTHQWQRSIDKYDEQNKKEVLQQLRDQYLPHSSYAHFTPLALCRTRKYLKKLQEYCDSAQKELNSITRRINDATSEVINEGIKTIKDESDIFPQKKRPEVSEQAFGFSTGREDFYNAYLNYLTTLEKIIDQENMVLAHAMLARLEILKNTKQFSQANVLLYLHKTMSQHGLRLFSREPGRLDDSEFAITNEVLYVFHEHIHGYMESAKLKNMPWLTSNASGYGIPLAMLKNNEHLILSPTKDINDFSYHLKKWSAWNEADHIAFFTSLFQYNLAIKKLYHILGKHDSIKVPSYDTTSYEPIRSNLSMAINKLLTLYNLTAQWPTVLKKKWWLILNEQETRLICYATALCNQFYDALSQSLTILIQDPQVLLLIPENLSVLYKFCNPHRVTSPTLSQTLHNSYTQLIDLLSLCCLKTLNQNSPDTTSSNKVFNFLSSYLKEGTNEPLSHAIAVVEQVLNLSMVIKPQQLWEVLYQTFTNNASQWEEAVIKQLMRMGSAGQLYAFNWVSEYLQEMKTIDHSVDFVKDCCVNYLDEVMEARSYLIAFFNGEYDYTFEPDDYSIILIRYLTINSDKREILLKPVENSMRDYLAEYTGEDSQRFSFFVNKWNNDAILTTYASTRFMYLWKHKRNILYLLNFKLNQAIQHHESAEEIKLWHFILQRKTCVKKSISHWLLKELLSVDEKYISDQSIKLLWSELKNDKKDFWNNINRFLTTDDKTKILAHLDRHYFTLIQKQLKDLSIMHIAGHIEALCKDINMNYNYAHAKFPYTQQAKQCFLKLLTSILQAPWTEAGCILLDAFSTSKTLKQYWLKGLQETLKKQVGIDSFNRCHSIIHEKFLKELPAYYRLKQLYGKKNLHSVIQSIETFLDSPTRNLLVWELLTCYFDASKSKSIEITEDNNYKRYRTIKRKYQTFQMLQARKKELQKYLFHLDYAQAYHEFVQLQEIIQISDVLTHHAHIYCLRTVIHNIIDHIKVQCSDETLTLSSLLEGVANYKKKLLTPMNQRILTNYQSELKDDLALGIWLCDQANILYQLNHGFSHQLVLLSHKWLNVFSDYRDSSKSHLVSVLSILKLLTHGLSASKQQVIVDQLHRIDLQSLNIYAADALVALIRLLTHISSDEIKDSQCINDAFNLADCLQKPEGEERARILNQLNKTQRIRNWYNIVNCQRDSLRQAKFDYWRRTLHSFFLGDGNSVTSQALIEGVTRGPCKLNPVVKEHLFKHDGTLKITYSANEKSKTARHEVLDVSYESETLYFKFYPDLAGFEYAVRSLHRLTLDPFVPYIELMRFPEGTAGSNVDYPVLVSQAITGTRLDEYLYNHGSMQWDKADYTRAFLLELLTSPLDGKPENQMVILSRNTSSNNSSHRLLCVDNDQSFVPTVTKNAKRLELQVKSILFCFDEMLDSLHPEIIDEFLTLDGPTILRQWLLDIQQKNKSLRNLFSEELRKQLLMRNKHNPMVLTMLIPEALITRLYVLFMRIQDILQRAKTTSENITHLQLMNELDPIFARFYEEAFQKGATPIERFEYIAKGSYQIIKEEKGRMHFGTSTKATDVLSLLYDEALEAKVVKCAFQAQNEIQFALDKLESLNIQYQALGRIVDTLSQGELKLFQTLHCSAFKEKVVHMLSPKLFQLSSKIQIQVLDAIKTVPLSRLSLINCKTLTDRQVQSIITYSPTLVYIKISGHSAITTKALEAIAYSPMLERVVFAYLPKRIINLNFTPGWFRTEICSSLKRLTITHSHFKTIKLKALKLVELTCTYNTSLSELVVETPSLHSINTVGNVLMTTLTVSAHQLTHAKFDQCPIVEPTLLALKVTCKEVFLQSLSLNACSKLKYHVFRMNYPGLSLLPLNKMSDVFINRLHHTLTTLFEAKQILHWKDLPFSLQQSIFMQIAIWLEQTHSVISSLLKVLKNSTWLNDSDKHIRYFAARALAVVCKHRPITTIPYLLSNLQDKDKDVRWGIVKALGISQEYLSNYLSQVITVLLNALKDNDSEVRAAAAKALGACHAQLGTFFSTVINALLVALKDDKIYRDAAYALSKCVEHDPRTIIPMIINAFQDCNSSVRCAAVLILGKIAEHNPSVVVPALTTAMKDNESYVRSEAVSALIDCHIMLDPFFETVIPALLIALQDSNSFTRRLVVRVLGKLHAEVNSFLESIIPALVNTVLNDSDYDVRSESAEVLGLYHAQLAPFGSTVIPALVTASKDSTSWIGSYNVRDNALHALGACVAHDPNTVIPALVTALKDSNEFVRGAAHMALKECLEHDLSIVILALVAAQKNNLSNLETCLVRDLVMRAQGVYEEHDPSTIIFVLLTALKSDYYVEWAALRKYMEHHDPSTVIPALLIALRYSNESFAVRKSAVKALEVYHAHVGSFFNMVISALVSSLEDIESVVRAAAAQALRKYAEYDSSTVVPALMIAFQDNESNVRSNAAQALGAWVVHDPRVVISTFLIALKNFDSWRSSPVIRKTAAQALGACVAHDPSTVIRALLIALEDSDWDVRKTVVQALGACVAHDSITVIRALLTALKDSDRYVRKTVVQVLVMCVVHDSSTKQIGEHVGQDLNTIKFILFLSYYDSGEDFVIRQAADKILEVCVGQNPNVIIPLLLTALQDKDKRLRCAAAKNLKHGVEHDPHTIISALLNTLKDNDSDVREHARYVLKDCRVYKEASLSSSIQNLFNQREHCLEQTPENIHASYAKCLNVKYDIAEPLPAINRDQQKEMSNTEGEANKTTPNEPKVT